MLEIGGTIRDGVDEWRIEREVGSGGLATVYEATNIADEDVRIAIKVPLPSVLAQYPKLAAKFEREAQILANLKHSNVVKILRFWRFDDGTMAIAQEYVRHGRSLDVAFADPLTDQISAFLQILYGLRAIHGTDGKGVVHRDLSPSNILVTRKLVKIIDFGIAKVEPRTSKALTHAGDPLGTPGCIAPEQVADAANVDGRADIYSVGRSIGSAIQKRSPEYLDISALPEPWQTICTRFCEYEADRRPTNASEALELALQELCRQNLLPRSLDLHVREQEKYGLKNPSASRQHWVALSDKYFNGARCSGLEMKHLLEASQILPGVFADKDFGAKELFDGFEQGSVGDYFRSRSVPYDAVDPYGKYLSRTYLGLDTERRRVCFSSLVRTAVRYNRYALMEYVRDVYQSEKSTTIQDELDKILEEQDPARVVEPRNVLRNR